MFLLLTHIYKKNKDQSQCSISGVVMYAIYVFIYGPLSVSVSGPYPHHFSWSGCTVDVLMDFLQPACKYFSAQSVSQATAGSADHCILFPKFFIESVLQR